MSLLTTTTPLTGTYQNQISNLPSLDDLRYENIFKVYQTSENHYYYNILNKVSISSDMDKNTYYTLKINQNMPWTTISYNAYGTIELWWLICIVNQITNPLVIPTTNRILKIIKPDYVRSIINEIHLSLQ